MTTHAKDSRPLKQEDKRVVIPPDSRQGFRQASAPSHYEITLLLSAVLISYSVLYGPQVMVSHWVTESLLSSQRASLLVYITLFPMSLTPLCYGYLFGRQETSRLIFWALLALNGTTLTLTQTHNFHLMSAMRLIQGLILPVIMTAVMSRLSAQGGQRGRRLITYYLCATVLGGLIGRLVSGQLTDIFGTRAPWWLWSVSLMSIAVLLMRLKKSSVPYNAQVCTPTRLRAALRSPSVLPSLACSALMFGVFAAALNLLPLRALELNPLQGSSAIAHRYWGYLAGFFVALAARSINKALGGKGRAPALGLMTLMVGLYWGSLEHTSIPLFGMVFLLCVGLFITHPILTAHITQISPEDRGLMSGLYVSSYYIGGSLGSAVLSRFYHHFGWSMSLWLLGVMSLLGALLALIALRNDPGS